MEPVVFCTTELNPKCTGDILSSLSFFKTLGLSSKPITTAELTELLLVLKYWDYVCCCLNDKAECFGLRRFCQLSTMELMKFRKNITLKDLGGPGLGEATDRCNMYTFD